MTLPEIGLEGQKTLYNASVLIVGAGGLGVVVATYLVSMGVGRVRVCDFDKVNDSNLHRQFFYFPSDIGQNKATVLKQKLKLQNPDVSIEDITARLDENNIQEIAEDFQIVCDCTDRPESRILINNFCKEEEIALVHGAVSDWQGYITVFHFKRNFSLEDLFDNQAYLTNQSCSATGVNSAICGIIGSYMVSETVKIILGLDYVLEGKLLYVNILNNSFREIKLNKTSST